MIGVQEKVSTVSEPQLSQALQSSPAGLFARRDDAYLLALRLTGQPSDAEDVVQDSYVLALHHDGRIPAGIEGWHWFQRVIINAARDRRSADSSRKARERSIAMEQNARADSQENENELQRRDDLRDALAGAMNTLDEHLRVILCLHYEQDIPYAKAAELLGENEGTLRANASRGIALLREKLSCAGYSVASATVVGTLEAGLGIQTPTLFAASLKTLIATAAAKGPAIAKGIAAKGAVAATTAKVAMTAVLVLAGAAVIGTAIHLSRGQIETKADADAPVATEPPASPLAGLPLGIDKSLAEILDKKIDVIYRREYLSEVLDDLDKHVGLLSAFPKPIDKTFVFTLEEKQITVKQVLEKLAAEGKLDLEYDGATVVFWKKADDKMLSGLAEKLKSADVGARCEAVYDLAGLGDPRIYPLIIEKLKDDKEAVAAMAVFKLSEEHREGLSHSKDKTSYAEPVLKFLSSTSNPHYKSPCAVLLGALGNKQGVDLLAAMTKDADASVRSAAASGLGQSRDPRAIDPLIALMKDADGYVLFTAARGLGQSRDPRAIDLLIPLTKDADADVRSRGALGLGQSRDPRAIDLLIPLTKDADANVRSMTASGLVRSCDPRAIDLLIALTKDADAEVRSMTAYRLWQLRDPRAIDLLITLTIDADANVRNSAANSLGQSRDPRAIDLLIALMKTADANMRSAMADGLGQSRDPRAIDPLIALTKDADANVRSKTVDGLGRSRDPRAFNPLIALAKDADDHVRYMVAVGLGLSRDPRAIDLLIALTIDDSFDVKNAAACSLIKSRDPRAFDALIALTKDADASVRCAAAEGLGWSRDPRAIDLLLELLMNQEKDVQEKAAFYLAQMFGHDERVKKALAEFQNTAAQPQPLEEF